MRDGVAATVITVRCAWHTYTVATKSVCRMMSWIMLAALMTVLVCWFSPIFFA